MVGHAFCAPPVPHFFSSDLAEKMEDELMRILQQVKVAGGKASLTFLVREGKTKARLEVELDSEPAPSSSSTPSAPRPRRRRLRQARGAPQQGAQSGSPPPSTEEGEAGHSPRPPRRPLKHLPVPPDGRQAVLTVGRPATPSFASLNMDGSPPSLPPRPPPPPPPSVQTLPNLKLRLWNPGKLDGKFMNTVAHTFKDRIWVLSVMVGAERYRCDHYSSWREAPPWLSSPR